MQPALKDSRSSTMSSICTTGKWPTKITTWWRKANQRYLSNKINKGRDITASCLMDTGTSSPSRPNSSSTTPSIANLHRPFPPSNPPSSAKAPPNDNQPGASTSSARAASRNTTTKMRPLSSPKSKASWNSSWARWTTRIDARARHRSWSIRSLTGLLGCRRAL